MSRVYFTDRDLGKYQTYAVERDCWPAQAGEQIKRKRADKGNGIPHLVPLAPQALAILEELRPLTGHGRYVFPSERGGARCMSENTVRAALRALG